MIPLEVIRVLFICSTALAMSATVPQLMKLVRVKSSREISLQSYGMWSGTQSVTVLYALTIGDIVLAISSAVWLTFYVIMTSLIIYYRRPSRILAEAVLSVDPESLTDQSARTGVQ